MGTKYSINRGNGSDDTAQSEPIVGRGSTEDEGSASASGGRAGKPPLPPGQGRQQHKTPRTSTAAATTAAQGGGRGRGERNSTSSTSSTTQQPSGDTAKGAPVKKGKKKSRTCGYFPKRDGDNAEGVARGPLRLTGRRGSRTHVVPPELLNPREDTAPVFEDSYTLEQEIGKGCSAIVRVCVSKSSGQRYAVKIIEKAKLPDPKMLANEVVVMKRIKHPNIIELVETFETDTHLFLVIELAEGGELFDRIVDQGRYSELAASRILYSVTKAVDFLHQCGIVHRDLKPENILFATKEGDSEVKLADFGFSTMVNDPDASMDCGTVEYVAPEILTRTMCTRTSDVWSIGVIMYILLCGFHPFYHENRVQFMKYIIEADYEFPSPEWDHISDSAKDLIRKILVVDPDERPSCESILAHPWMTGNAAPENELSVAMVSNMKAFAKRQRKERRRRRNVYALGSIARKLYGDKTEEYNQFMRQHNYSDLADHAISMAVYGAENADDEAYTELLISLQDMTEQEMISKVASQLFPDDKSRQDFLDVSM